VRPALVRSPDQPLIGRATPPRAASVVIPRRRLGEADDTRLHSRSGQDCASFSYQSGFRREAGNFGARNLIGLGLELVRIQEPGPTRVLETTFALCLHRVRGRDVLGGLAYFPQW
jgi:hypothetical protein